MWVTVYVVGDTFYIGNSVVTVDSDSDLYIHNRRFKGMRGLWELLTRKTVDKKLVTDEDLKQYKDILDLTSAHLKGYEPTGAIRISRGNKYRNVITHLYPQTRDLATLVKILEMWQTSCTTILPDLTRSGH